MKISPDQAAENPFSFRECFLRPMPIGKKALNFRELLQALRDLDKSVLYYNIFQSRLDITQPADEYPNEFARWAANA